VRPLEAAHAKRTQTNVILTIGEKVS